MKLLAVSDQVIERLYSTAIKENYADVHAIIGCGDLPYDYLEFLVSVLNIPLFYVPGNHDPKNGMLDGQYVPGGINIDQQVLTYKGLRIAGLGGSIKYQPNVPNQYTQIEMFWRMWKILPYMWWLALRGRPLDILVTHSPPAGIHDDESDSAHRGLQAINFLIKLTKPRYMLHGHTIFYQQNLQNHMTRYQNTEIINVYPFRTVEIN